MNPYAALDPALRIWAQRHGLHVVTRSHHETELRQFTIVDDSGDTYGVSFTAPDHDQQVGITLYSVVIGGQRNAPQKQLFRCRLTELSDILESVYATVETWIRQKGHTRTPIL